MNLLEIILNIIIFLMIFQVSTIIHEFGHALSALILTKENVKITLGRNNQKLKKRSLRRLDIELKGFNPFIGFVHCETKLTKFQSIMILAGGPIISLVLGILLLLISRNIQDKLLLEIILLKEMLTLSANYQLFIFILTSMPIIYPKWWAGYGGYPSDGYQIFKLMKANKFN